MLNVLRNHVIDEGIYINSQKYLSKKLYENVLHLDNNELKICHKISQGHLTVRGSERQNVRKAAQLFSNTIANFIFQFMPNEFQAGQFILLINKLFDIFNSRLEVNKSNPAFTGSLDQILILNDALFAIKNIKIPRINKNNETVFRNAFMHFQIGIIQSINA